MTSSIDTIVPRFKALADPARLRVVNLCGHGECSVSELTKVLGLSQPRMSQHLKQLCDAGLLQRFRDGHFVYYRVHERADASTRRLLDLIPKDSSLERDLEKLRELRGTGDAHPEDASDRPLHKVLIELTVTAPLGDLLDIGCGQGRILKLLASRAQRAVGVDIDADARRFARAELLLAGLPHCTLRQGDMYALPFADGEFETVILDDVLSRAERPVRVIQEAGRLLRSGGRLLLLSSLDDDDARQCGKRFAEWCRSAGLRMTAPRGIPAKDPRWLLSVATTADTRIEAA